jgi:hypothetical protein
VLDESSEQGVRSLTQAVEERQGNQKGTLAEARRGVLDWRLKFWLKILLFAFVISMNVWWDTRVSDWIWYSGYIHGSFHLSDPVLIALATTSVANFLALILIVAKHLFPSDK